MNTLTVPTLTSEVTVIQYLTQERQATEKHEFVEGIIYAMAGANKEYNIITVNIVSVLHQQFKQRSCNVYANDIRVKVNQTDYFYPDVVAVWRF